MNKITREFISFEDRFYRFKIGNHVASSLAGFIAGVLLANIVWGVIFYLSREMV